jgi:hypothetical protein
MIDVPVSVRQWLDDHGYESESVKEYWVRVDSGEWNHHFPSEQKIASREYHVVRLVSGREIQFPIGA